MKKVAIYLSLAMACCGLQAQVYVCKDASGNASYSGTPCGPNPRVIDQNTLNRNNLDSSGERREAARYERTQRGFAPSPAAPGVTLKYTPAPNLIVAPEDRILEPNLDKDRWLERQAKAYSNTVNNYQGCPTDTELRNFRVGANSLTATSIQKRELRNAQEFARECIANGGNALLAKQTIEARKLGESATAEPRSKPPQDMGVPPPGPTPSRITSCNGSGCFDDIGGRYTRGQNGNFYNSDAKLCRQTGNRFTCN